MSIELWLAFVIATAVLLIIPGPTILTVISYSIALGWRASIPLIAAVILGNSTAAFASLVGLGALLKVSAFWFATAKWIGGAYLLYMGYKLLRAGVSTTKSLDISTTESKWKIFANTYFVTALNPQGIIFFVAFLPQFTSSSSNVVHQLWMLTITFVIMATINATLYAIFAGSARTLLLSVRAQRRFNLAGGISLSFAGGWSLLARQPA